MQKLQIYSFSPSTSMGLKKKINFVESAQMVKHVLWEARAYTNLLDKLEWFEAMLRQRVEQHTMKQGP